MIGVWYPYRSEQAWRGGKVMGGGTGGAPDSAVTGALKDCDCKAHVPWPLPLMLVGCRDSPGSAQVTPGSSLGEDLVQPSSLFSLYLY